MEARDSDFAELESNLRAGDRRALARAITLVESTRPEDRDRAGVLIQRVLPASGASVRIGISGAPGVGKSTFIEAFGLHLIARGKRPAVLAVDPSSPRSGGSILGDKTRMEELARDPRAFIRPSPAGGTLGGVARRTREAMLLCEAAGYDVLIVETVGVGQSEIAVANLVDVFALLVSPAGGDELQGLKKGIVELAHLVVVNKNDGDLAPAAGRAAAEYRAAVHMLRQAAPGWTTAVIAVSSREHRGMDDVWAAIESFNAALGEDQRSQRRGEQAKAWLWNEIQESLIERLKSAPDATRLNELETKVFQGLMSPHAAARAILAGWSGKPDPSKPPRT